MKRLFIIVALLATTMLAGQAAPRGKKKIIEKKEGSITFVVDEDLSRSKHDGELLDGKKIADRFFDSVETPGKPNIVATSFANDKNMRSFGKDAFFRTVVTAYANHLSLVLSPDMVWMLISQGFARYVNAHPEEMRHQLVEHDGKMDLVVVTYQDLQTGNPDWEQIMGDFSDSIQKYTRGDIAKALTADFTTTTPVTRIASEITLMESVKSYFEYVVVYLACGIPSITLQGTPEDWQQVLDKAKQLKSYALSEWIEELEPILEEFVRAAEGKPNQEFWQKMVKQVRLPQLKGGGGCDPTTPTQLDGWVLKFFPDEQGVTPSKKDHDEHMPADRVCVDFQYKIVGALGGILAEYSMQLWAGFIGAEEDVKAHTLTPKIGWLVRIDDQEELLHDLQEMNQEDENGWLRGIDIRVKEVPAVLAKMGHIRQLKIEFTNKVNLPTWMDKLTIDQFTIVGTMTDEEETAIIKRFPKAYIQNQKSKMTPAAIEKLKAFEFQPTELELYNRSITR